MVEQLASPVAVAFTWMLLHFLWQGLLIAVLYRLLVGNPVAEVKQHKPSSHQDSSRKALGGSCRTARNRYAISLLMLSAMAICPMLTFAWLYNPSISVNYISFANPKFGSLESNKSNMEAKSQLETKAIEIFGELQDGSKDVHATVMTSNSLLARPWAIATQLSSIRLLLDNAQPYLLLLWGFGVMISGLRIGSGYTNIVWLHSGIKPIPDALKHRSVFIARKLGLEVSRVFASSRIREAAVVGFCRPMVLIPTSWLTSLPPTVLEAVIAHELAHIRRLDVWVNLLQCLLESMFFYHPAVWWLSNCVRLEREMCCDALAAQVIGNRGQYAMALEQVGRMQVFGTPSLATSFRGDGKMKLHSRIQNILGTSNAPAHEPALLVGIALTALALVLTGVIGNGVRSNIATAQDREPKFSEQERPSQDRRAAPQEEEPPLTDRERKLMETVKELQLELNELRRKVQSENLSDTETEFRLYDRDRDSEISRQEWFEKYLLDIPRSRASISGLEKLKRRHDELLKERGEFDKEVQDLKVTIFVFEAELKGLEVSFLEVWNRVDSNRNDVVTQVEFARWWNQGARLLSGHPGQHRPSQILRRDRLEPLIDQKKILLGKFSENHPAVADVTILIESLEERIKSMEEEERKGSNEKVRSLNDARDRGPRDGDRTFKGPRDGDASRVIFPTEKDIPR